MPQNVPDSSSPTIIRLNTDGSVDSTFSQSDESFAPSPNMLTSANGYIYLISYTYIGGDGPYGSVLQRYHESTGQLDTAFSAVTVPGQNVTGYLVQPNGQILVWGDAVYRRNADGSLDTTFQNSLGSSLDATPSGMSVTSSGSIYIWGGFTTIEGVSRSGIARLNSDGTVDTSFVPTSGIVTSVGQVYQEPTGSLLVFATPTTGWNTLIRFNANGSQDTSFQSPTMQGENIYGFTQPYLSTITETSDHKILIYGNIISVNQTSVPGYTKLNLDGTLDASFVANTGVTGLVQNVFVQPDGEFLVVGKLTQPDGYAVPLVLVQANGSIDSGFNLIPTNQITNLGEYIAGPVLVQSDGKILANLTYYNPPDIDGGGVGVIIENPNPGNPPPPPPIFLRYYGEGNYVPNPPDTINVTSVSAQLTQITWDAIGNATGYQIEREEAGQWVVIGSVGTNVTTYNDQTADGATNFSYEVEAKNASGVSLPSPAAAASPPTPFTAFLPTVISPTQVGLSWSAVSNTWDYEIYRMNGTANTNYIPDPSTVMTKIETIAANATSCVDTTASPLQTYTYVVLARDVAGTADTEPLSVTTPAALPPVTPTRLQAGSFGPSEIEVVWEASLWSDGYSLQCSSDGGTTWQTIASLGYSSTSYVDASGLSSGQTYLYRISAYNAEGSTAFSTVVAGIAPGSTWRPPGTLDPSFAPNPPLTNVASAKISPSGAVYYDYWSSFSDANLLGEVNATGAGTGFSPYFIGSNTQFSIVDYLPLSGGKVLVSANVEGVFFVQRLDSAGNEDSSFTSPTDGEESDSLTPLHNGDVIVVGAPTFDGVASFGPDGVLRLNPDGSIDNTFQVSYPINDDTFSNPVEQSDGKLIVNCDGTTLVRLLVNGQQDPTFGNAGQVVISGGNQFAQVVQSDDKIVIAGNFTAVDDGSGPVTSNSLVRLTADGKIDPTFSVGSGIIPTTIISPSINGAQPVISYQKVNSLTIDSQGRILVQGTMTQYDTIPCATLIRLLPNGQLDPSFMLPQNFDSSNFVMNNDGLTFYAGTTLHRYFYGPTSNAPPMTFSQWQTANSMTMPATATPQNDRVPNLLKYLYHINPSLPMSEADYAALPALGTTTSGGTSYLTLTYRQNEALTGVTVNVQTSSDLTTWQTMASSNLIQTGTDPTTGDPIMQAQSPMAGGKQFLRLNVTSP